MGKILVTYFSATGATKRLAEKIAKLVDADIFEIEPVVKYSTADLDWTDSNSRSSLEMKSKSFRPPTLKKLDNVDDYSSVVIGFPVWWYAAPTIINTFIEENNLQGKKVYVVVTSGATGVEGSLKKLRKEYPNINFIGGKRFNGGFMKDDVVNWISA